MYVLELPVSPSPTGPWNQGPGFGLNGVMKCYFTSMIHVVQLTNPAGRFKATGSWLWNVPSIRTPSQYSVGNDAISFGWFIVTVKRQVSMSFNLFYSHLFPTDLFILCLLWACFIQLFSTSLLGPLGPFLTSFQIKPDWILTNNEEVGGCGGGEEKKILSSFCPD